MLRPSGELLVRFNQTVAIVPWARQVLKDSYVRSNISNVVFGDFFLFLDRLLTPVSPGQISLKNYPGTEATPKGSTHPLSIHKRPPQRETPTMRTTMLQSIPKRTTPSRDPPQRGLSCFKASQKGPPQRKTPTKGITLPQVIPKRATLKKDPRQSGLPCHKTSQKEPL